MVDVYFEFLEFCGNRRVQSTQRCPQMCSKIELKRRKCVQSRAATWEKSTCFKQVTNPTGVKGSAGSELQKVSHLSLSCGGTWEERGRAFKAEAAWRGKMRRRMKQAGVGLVQQHQSKEFNSDVETVKERRMKHSQDDREGGSSILNKLGW